jgi:hypothetical protein
VQVDQRTSSLPHKVIGSLNYQMVGKAWLAAGSASVIISTVGANGRVTVCISFFPLFLTFFLLLNMHIRSLFLWKHQIDHACARVIFYS